LRQGVYYQITTEFNKMSFDTNAPPEAYASGVFFDRREEVKAKQLSK